MDSITITDGNVSISGSQNLANQFFGVSQNYDGSITLNGQATESMEQNISKEIQQEVLNNQKVIKQIKESNPHTKLSNQEILDMYDSFNNDGFFII